MGGSEKTEDAVKYSQAGSYAGDVAPLLPALHQAQSSEGCLTRKALEKIADSFRLPIADLYTAATFYHYFSIDGGRPIPRAICRGPACSLAGIKPSEKGHISSISCPGLCDQPVPEYGSGEFLSPAGPDGGFRLPIASDQEALFRYVRAPDPQRLENYEKAGGYRQLLRCVRTEVASKALEILHAGGLAGRGGAAFPLAAKWRAVREATEAPKYVICNADEGEPGTFKDRPLLHLAPHLLLEAMAICGYLVGANTGIIYLRYEYPQALEVLTRAIEEAEQAGLLGSRIAGSDFTFRIVVRRGAGAYVCGEESSLLNSLEGRRPWPRERPPFPTTNGLWEKPTVVNNVETLCWVPLILEKGAEWFRSLGRGENCGTKIYSVSGKVQRPGNYELPLGVTARELLLDYSGGPLPGHTLKAFTLGGVSGGLLAADRLDLALDYKGPQRYGVFLGSGGIIVLDDSCCVVDFLRSCMLFYEAESCGKCSPCRIGTIRLREFLDGLTDRASLQARDLKHIEDIVETMTATSACGLGQTAPLVVASALKWFGKEVNEHLHNGRCPAEVCKL